jgi:hypothetical protein
MCGPTQGLEQSEWISVLTPEGEFVLPNFSILTIQQALLNYHDEGRNDAIMAQDSNRQPTLIYPNQIISVVKKA